MARKGNAQKRQVLPDSKYKDTTVAKLINRLIIDGKKSVAERVLYGAFDIIEEKSGGDPFKLFKKALDNIRPSLEVKSRRVGGATYQVPVEVRYDRKLALALRWLVSFSRGRSENSMKDRLAAEIMDAANSRGGAVKKREDVHKMAEANKAFAHFRW